MALLRIEPKLDDASGNYLLEVFWPSDAERPFVTTQPRYKSTAAAENDLIAIIAAAASTPRKSS